MTYPNENRKKITLYSWLMPLIVVVSLGALFAITQKRPQSGDSAPNGFPSDIIADSIPDPVDLSEYGKSKCMGCHSDQHDDWLPSPHALAATSEPFSSTFNHVYDKIGVPKAVQCLECHAPLDSHGGTLDENGRVQPEAFLSEGISCAVCHLGKGFVLKSTSGLIPTSMHDEALWARRPRNAEFCSNCHNPSHPLMEILTPDAGFIKPAGNPFMEWLESGYSDDESPNYKACIDCHGQNGFGTVHNWPGKKPEIIKSAYSMDFQPYTFDGMRIESSVTITNDGCGHKLPTGDPGHMLTFEFHIVDERGMAMFMQEYTMVGDMLGDEDTRLAPGEKIQIPLASPAPANWTPSLDSLTVKYTVSYSPEPNIRDFLAQIGISSEPLIIEEGLIRIPQAD
ncbi:MAG TPA: hypothetical protein ENN67_07855 [Firmicutes bacterium]|nr:hypothetical protein [Bacillota bacterium]